MLVRPVAIIRRYRQIAGTLARHGLGFMAIELGLGRYLPLHKGLLGFQRRDEPYTRGEHLRLALEELGAAFIKLGQILSTRPDLIPEDLTTELSKLQDAAPPIRWSEIERLLGEELGRPAGDAFRDIETIPLASASIGQVHRGTLHNGEPVAVKVRRPGVRKQVAIDLEVMRRLGRRAAAHPMLAMYRPMELVEEFARTIRDELDYVRERLNLERFARDLLDEEGVRAPHVYESLSTPGVLTMEYIDGIRIDDLPGLGAVSIDRAELAQRMAGLLFRSSLERGFFHADPHPGNFRVMPDGTLVMLDFGMMGYVSPAERNAILEIVFSVVENDPERITDRLIDLGLRGDEAGILALQREIGRVIYDYTDLPLGEIPIGELFVRMFELVRTHQLYMASHLSVLTKTILMAEGLGKRLDPEFTAVPVLKKLIGQSLTRRLRPEELKTRLQVNAMDTFTIFERGPRSIRKVISQIEKGELQVRMNFDSHSFLHELERIARSFKMSALAAASIVALAVLMLVYQPPGWETSATWIFIGGVLATGFLIGYLIYDSWRSGLP